MFLFFEMGIPNDLPETFPSEGYRQVYLAVPMEDAPPDDQPSEQDEIPTNPEIDDEFSMNNPEEFPGQQPQIQSPENINPEDQQFQLEIEPLKKVFLIQKLNNLNYTLKKSLKTDTDLSLLIKYGNTLSYQSLYRLAIGIIENLKNEIDQAKQNEIPNQSQEIASNG